MRNKPIRTILYKAGEKDAFLLILLAPLLVGAITALLLAAVSFA